MTMLLVSAADASAQVFIKPEPGTECPSSPCPTINELLEQHEHYFTSHTTLHFLTGLHVVAAEQSSVTVNCSAGCAWMGNTNADFKGEQNS